MNDFQLSTPVAFFVFNRPEPAARVFAEIRRARPPKLLVVADGPRADRPQEAANCAAVREAIQRGVDWPCEVETLYAEKNLGCRVRVSSGLDWVFSRVEEAIILEDDCLPDPTFFRFCEETLVRYRDDRRIMMISGTCQHTGSVGGELSYQYALTGHIWGWASWRRAWAHYDVDLRIWPTLRDRDWLNGLNPLFFHRSVVKRWTKAFEDLYSGGYDSWDWQWNLTCWLQHGLSVVPVRNLITNIGFGSGATHTHETGTPDDARRAVPMTFPLVHPTCFAGDAMADYQPQDFSSRVKRLPRRILSRLTGRQR